MKNILTSIIILLSIFTIKAQVPGYMGQKIIVEVQGFVPPLMGYIFETLGAGMKVHSEYAIRRKNSLGIDYSQMTMRSATESDSKNSYKSQSLVLTYSIYRKNWSLAPYGKFFNFGLGFNNRELIQSQFKNVKGNYISLHAAMGNRLIFAKRFSFTYSFEAGVPLSIKNLKLA